MFRFKEALQVTALNWTYTEGGGSLNVPNRDLASFKPVETELLMSKR
jgi:hypothetical protein